MIYSKYEALLFPLVKFLLAFAVLNTLNGEMGYMTQLDSMAVVLIVALMCSFLPTGCILLFAALFSLLHMYALSIEILLVGFCLYLVIFLLYLRFCYCGADALTFCVEDTLCTADCGRTSLRTGFGCFRCLRCGILLSVADRYLQCFCHQYHGRFRGNCKNPAYD